MPKNNFNLFAKFYFKNVNLFSNLIICFDLILHKLLKINIGNMQFRSRNILKIISYSDYL